MDRLHKILIGHKANKNNMKELGCTSESVRVNNNDRGKPDHKKTCFSWQKLFFFAYEELLCKERCDYYQKEKESYNKHEKIGVVNFFQMLPPPTLETSQNNYEVSFTYKSDHQQNDFETSDVIGLWCKHNSSLYLQINKHTYSEHKTTYLRTR